VRARVAAEQCPKSVYRKRGRWHRDGIGVGESAGTAFTCMWHLMHCESASKNGMHDDDPHSTQI
jgi:hypothetical protein